MPDQEPDVYNQVLQLVAKERQSRGKPAIMKGHLITRLINAVDSMLDYEPIKEKKE